MPELKLKGMSKGYALEWLDTLVTVTLNPAKTKTDISVPGDIVKIQEQVIVQRDKVHTVIKSTIFCLDDETKIRCLINKYHSSLITLLDQAIEDQAHIKNNSPVREILDTIICCIDELLSLIEHRFKSYLSVGERVPATYLKVAQKEVIKQLSAIDKKFLGYATYKSTFQVVKQEFETFLSRSPDKHNYIFQEILYIRDMCLELELLEAANEATTYSRLDELLINMNFNSKIYISHLTTRLAETINSIEQADRKMDTLLFHFKLFKQYRKKKGLIFNTQYADLQKQISNWFTQEIFYLEKQMHYSIIPIKAPVFLPKPTTEDKTKVLSILSVDQMALILRAADELKIVMSRSLNNVFKTIVPYLSTPYQEDISFDSMRSKSYSAEIRDKEIVTETLLQIIKKINDY